MAAFCGRFGDFDGDGWAAMVGPGLGHSTALQELDLEYRPSPSRA